MKQRWNRAFALMLTMMLAVKVVAAAEGIEAISDVYDDSMNVGEIEQPIAGNTEPAAEEVGELLVGEAQDLPVEEETVVEDTYIDPDWNEVQSGWPVVDEEPAVAPEILTGEETLQPETVDAPENADFDDLYLEDGADLVPEDMSDLANQDAQIPDTSVSVQFIEVEEPTEETDRQRGRVYRIL